VFYLLCQQFGADSCFLCLFYLWLFIGRSCLAVGGARCLAMWVDSTWQGVNSFCLLRSQCAAFELIAFLLWCVACMCWQYFTKEIWQGGVLGTSSAERARWEGTPLWLIVFWELIFYHIHTCLAFTVTNMLFSFIQDEYRRDHNVQCKQLTINFHPLALAVAFLQVTPPGGDYKK
jgi:ABC-type Co2+ transport system permease subunit